MERFDKVLMASIQVSAWLTGMMFICWGALLVAAQALAWLNFGSWQSIPLFSLWLSPTEQFNQLVHLELLTASWSPLVLIPSLSDYSSLVEVSRAIGGSMEGLVKLIQWLLSAPLSATLWLLGFVLVSTSGAVEQSNLQQSY